jgi:predicted phage terminase large subunit-like protein
VTLSATYQANGDIYVREAFRDHLSTKQGAERLFVNFDKWQQHRTVVESRCKEPNEDAIIEEIRERQRIYGILLNLKQVKPDRDKVRRAHLVQSIVQQGRVYFDMTDPGQQALLSELTMFTGDQKFHDDLVDAFVYALTEIKERKGRDIGQKTVEFNVRV